MFKSGLIALSTAAFLVASSAAMAEAPKKEGKEFACKNFHKKSCGKKAKKTSASKKAQSKVKGKVIQ